MSNTASTITILASLLGLVGIQTYWIASRLESMERRLDRLEARLDDMFGVLQDVA
jgi:hypothetical protein